MVDFTAAVFSFPTINVTYELSERGLVVKAVEATNAPHR